MAIEGNSKAACSFGARSTNVGGDLANRMAERGFKLPSVDDIPYRVSTPDILKAREGSLVLNHHMQAVLAELLKQRTVAELRDVCRLRGTATLGTKDDLIHRLAYQKEFSTTSVGVSMQQRKIVSTSHSGMSPHVDGIFHVQKNLLDSPVPDSVATCLVTPSPCRRVMCASRSLNSMAVSLEKRVPEASSEKLKHVARRLNFDSMCLPSGEFEEARMCVGKRRRRKGP